jgi:hypothetical protein
MAITAPVVLPPHLRRKNAATDATVHDASTSPPAPPVAVSKPALDFEDITPASTTTTTALAVQPDSQSAPHISYIKIPPVSTAERSRLKQLLHHFLQRFDSDSTNLRTTAPSDFYAVLPESLIELFETASSRISSLQSLGHLAVPKDDQKSVAPAFLVELITVQNQLDGIPGISFTMPVWDSKRLAHAITMKDKHGFNQALLVCLCEERECAVCRGLLPFGTRATVLGCKERCVVHEECVDVGKYRDAVAKCPVCQSGVWSETDEAAEVEEASIVDGVELELGHG